MAESYLYQVTDGVVYFIDAADTERFEESQIELNVSTWCEYTKAASTSLVVSRTG